MGYIEQMQKIEARARALNLPFAEVLRRASIDYGTWWRWNQGRSSPRLWAFNGAITRLEAVLAAEEARLAAIISGAA